MSKFLMAPVAVAALVLGANPAFAWEEFTVTVNPSPWSNVGLTATGIVDASSGLNVNSSASQAAARFMVNVAGTNSSHGGVLANNSSFETYCVDLTQFAPGGMTTSGHGYSLVSSTAQVTAAKLADINKLYTVGSLWASTDASTAAAFQSAIWEVVYETGGSYDLFNDNMKFGVAGSNSASLTDLTTANSLFTGLGSVNALYSSQVLHSEGSQDFLVMTPVPEPEGYALAFAGLACIGLFGRKFRATK